ncbi:phage portal protein [Castellaniella sp. S9]|uniref:phage portal protein n=1 Tax=Castellaniella sp. S9 TaxID=2993652 RepID=UPI0022B5706A|nr:phage portal protein [Castellaniella sp. S9]
MAGWINRLIGAARSSVRQAQASNEASIPTAHEAAGTGRRLRLWRPMDTSPRLEHRRLGLLRARSRDACRNNPIARAGIDRLTSDIVGEGVSPKPLADDESMRVKIIDAWEAWSDECDMDGQTDFYGLQTMAIRAMLESGEVLALLEPDEATGIPLKIRLLESDHLPFKNETLKNGGRIIDGIELNARGQRVAYWLHPNHPGDSSLSNNEPKRIPADRVLHLFESTRPGQLRGVPVLSPVLVRLKDIDEFDDAQIVRQKIANLFVGFITRPAPELGMEEMGQDGKPLPEDRTELPALEFAPGVLQELGPGERVEFSEPPGTTTGYRDFTTAQLHIIAAALGMPYPFLTGDYSDVNDRVMRVAINEYKRRAMALIHNVLVPQFCRPIRNAWVDAAVLAGALPTGRPDLKSTRWTPNAWAYIHPVQDIQADVLAINNKLMSRSEAILKRGYDAEMIDREIANDLAREKALGLPPSPASREIEPDSQETAPQERR